MKRYPPIIAKTPHMLHGGDYNPEQWINWKDTIWKEDIRLAKLAGINTLSVGIFSWSMLEPSEGEFNFQWLDEILDMMAENNMVAVLATPSGARPAWMSQKYPEVLRVRSDRRRNLHGGRHNHCMSSPVYREKVRIINTKLAERYHNHPALGLWHVSNEIGGECHCELCQERFRIYLKDKYITLDAVNDAWWANFWSHTYTDWSQIESPSERGESNTHGLTLDWKRFTTEQFVDFYKCEIKPLKHFSPHIPCTTNLMATYDGLDYMRLAEVLDVVSWDNYPEWTGDSKKDIAVALRTGFLHDLMYGLKRKPFLIMESSPSATNWRSVAKLHRPGGHILQSMQGVAHGSDSVQYFQIRKGRGSSEKMHGAVIDHEGSENTRVFREVAETGKILAGLDNIVGTTKPSKVALIHDYNNSWAIGDIQGALQSKNNYRKTLIEHYGAFWNFGIPVDIIDETCCLKDYDILVAPMLYMIRGNFAERVTEFVEQGGTFITTYMSGYVNDTDLCFTGGFPGPLKKLLGIWAEELDALYPEDVNAINWNGKSYNAFELCELIHSQGAEILGTYNADFYAGQPALTCNTYGKGKAYYIAARTGSDFLKEFYSMILSSAGIKPFISKPLPEGVNAQVRTDGNKNYIFLMNFTSEDKTVTIHGKTVVLKPRGVEIVELD